MICPYCHSNQTFVVNSRSTNNEMQIWRRRLCNNCQKRFTTHEAIDLSHLSVSKGDGHHEKFSRIKLYSGIFWATHGVKIIDRQKVVDRITNDIEKEILLLKKKVVTSEEIAQIVLNHLYKSNTSIFLRFLSYRTQIRTKGEMQRELKKYQ